MKHLIRNVFVAILSVGFAGCEWGGGGDSNSWNDSGSIANFNGSYRGSGSGGYLVSQYSTASSGSPGSTTTISGETIGTGDGSSTVYSGSLLHTPVISGSLQITAGGFSFSDVGGGVLNGSVSGTSGTINYGSGGWAISGSSLLIGSGVSIVASYAVTNSGTSSSGVTPGSTDAIYAFNVQQSGNKIKIIDNNGSVYEGSFGDMRTTCNLGSGSQGSTFVNGDQVIASFSASGKSKAGMYVNMTGNFQGTVQGVSTVTTKSGSSTITTTSMALSDRRIIGTWIEDGGMTGDISGVSASAVNVTSSSTTTNSI